MSMKEVYEALEKLEGGEKLVELVKTSEVKIGDLEKENRTLVSTAEQYKDLDFAKLQTAGEFVEKNGGIEGVQGLIAKAEGYEDNAEKMKLKDDENLALKQKFDDQAVAHSEDIAKRDLHADLLPDFVKAYGGGANVMLDRAIEKGLVAKGETGLITKIGDTATDFKAGGFDKLKELSDFSFGLQKPSGGDEGAGSGSGDCTSNEKPKTLEQKLQEDFVL